MVVIGSFFGRQAVPLPAMQVLKRQAVLVSVPAGNMPAAEAAADAVSAVPLASTTVPNKATRDGAPLPPTTIVEGTVLPAMPMRMPSPVRPPVFCCRISLGASKLAAPLTMNNWPAVTPPSVAGRLLMSKFAISVAARTCSRKVAEPIRMLPAERSCSRPRGAAIEPNEPVMSMSAGFIDASPRVSAGAPLPRTAPVTRSLPVDPVASSSSPIRARSSAMSPIRTSPPPVALVAARIATVGASSCCNSASEICIVPAAGVASPPPSATPPAPLACNWMPTPLPRAESVAPRSTSVARMSMPP